MTIQPTTMIDAAFKVPAHATLAAHADAAQSEAACDHWLGYESCHPLTWLPACDPEPQPA